MAFDEVPLNRTTSPASAEEPPPPPSVWRWIAVAVGGIAAVAVLVFWWMSRAQPAPATPAATTATDVAVGSGRPNRQALDLPALDGSDAWLANLVSTLSRHPSLARLMATRGIVRGTTLAVVQIGQGRTPSVPLSVLRPSARLQIVGTPTGRVDPKSYARWDTTVAALTTVAPADAAQLYVNVKPLFDQAYVDLGNPAGDFDAAIVRAIGMLEDVPEQKEDPQLRRGTNYFEHEDAALRALPPVQKQFLLVGPDNRAKVLAWLRQFAAALDLKVE